MQSGWRIPYFVVDFGSQKRYIVITVQKKINKGGLMSDETKVFAATLSNGIKYEIHESKGFSGRSEIALMVEGEVAFVLDTEVKRTGNIICKPLQSKFIRIKKEPDTPEQELTLNLSDIVGPEGDPAVEDDQS